MGVFGKKRIGRVFADGSPEFAVNFDEDFFIETVFEFVVRGDFDLFVVLEIVEPELEEIIMRPVQTKQKFLVVKVFRVELEHVRVHSNVQILQVPFARASSLSLEQFRPELVFENFVVFVELEDFLFNELVQI